MNLQVILDGLISYLCLLVLLTFHEFAHAWTAWKCGDNTAYNEGRVSLNPIVHMDLLGTVVLPLLVVLLSAANSQLASFIIGWGRPVPVDASNLRHRRLQDTLIALAGPAMNLLLAAILIPSVHLLRLGNQPQFESVIVNMAQLSLLLCFFNLLPVPPLDGSHFVKNLFHISDELYLRVAQYGFLIVILLLQFPLVRFLLGYATNLTLYALARLSRLG